MRKIDHHHCSGVPCDICGPDPRDAEIGMLLGEIARLRLALAAGPAALRNMRPDDYSTGYLATVVEAAQAAAMKEGA